MSLCSYIIAYSWDVCMCVLCICVCLWYSSICSGKIRSWDLDTEALVRFLPKQSLRWGLYDWLIQEWTGKKGESVHICTIELAIAKGEWLLNPQDFLRSLMECSQTSPWPPPRNVRRKHITVSLWILLSGITLTKYQFSNASHLSMSMRSGSCRSFWLYKKTLRQKWEVWGTRVQVQGKSLITLY